jgi:hypothetical protein
VLGYICNESRRFYIYVANRVGKIRLFSKPSQRHFIRTECNPADVATRSIDASQLDDSTWLHGPNGTVEVLRELGFNLVNPDYDKEIRPNVVSFNQELNKEDSFEPD